MNGLHHLRLLNLRLLLQLPYRQLQVFNLVVHLAQGFRVVESVLVAFVVQGLELNQVVMTDWQDCKTVEILHRYKCLICVTVGDLTIDSDNRRHNL